LKNYEHKQGFVLIELATTLSIISILVIMTLPSYIQYLKQAKISEGIALVNNVQQAIVDYYAHTGNFPANIQAVGLTGAQKLKGKYVTDIQVENGAIHLSFNDKSLSKSTPLLSFRPALLTANPNNTIISWVCGYAEVLKNTKVMGNNKTTIKALYLPLSCR